MKMKTFITAIMLMMSMMSFANGEQDYTGEHLEDIPKKTVLLGPSSTK